MAAVTAVWLPHLGAALVVAMIVGTAAARFSPTSITPRRLWFAAAFVLVLAPNPIMDLASLSWYVRVVTGDLSIVTLGWFLVLSWHLLLQPVRPAPAAELRMAATVIAVAVVLYPTALGVTYFDLYAYGYYPVVLAPVVFVLFAGCIWYGVNLPAVLLAAGFSAFALGLLESDNLWDYLVDPVLVVYSVVLVITHRRHLPSWKANQEQVETWLLITIATFLLFAVFLSRFNADAFRFDFVIEDGFVEWCTVVVLFVTMVVCGKRFWRLRQCRSPLFLSVTALLTLLCLFGAGEEISWGQRIFGLETPDYFKERNAQGELGLHNLVVEINGEEVKLNKLIFGTGLAIGLSIYLFIATPLYRRKPMVRRFFNAIAAPMPRNYQVIGYLAIVATVELLIDSSKRGEMTEFAGSIMFALNVIYPYNPEIFDPGKKLEHQT